ncbi:MAG: MBL fold metallo-hydrolase, partial [Chloroflexota bacterium]|nr:MBL fold metallo-hydrolase [Chloroflexota bacterium]
MKLTDRVYLVGSGSSGVSLTDDFDCNVYLLDGGSEAALIDAGGGRDIPAIIKNIQDDGIPLARIRYLLLTHGHADHSAGAARLRESLGLQVLAANDIANFLRQGDESGISLDLAKKAGIYPPDFCFPACPVDVELAEDQRIIIGDCELKVMETPGHAAGCLSFLMERSGKQYLFSGDVVFYGGLVALQNIPDCDLQAYIRSIQRLAGLSVDVFLPGHLGFSLKNGQR